MYMILNLVCFLVFPCTKSFKSIDNQKFLTNIIIDESISEDLGKSREELLEELVELEKQTTNEILFTQSSKHMDQVNKEDPYPYYDKSQSIRTKRLESLKTRMLQLRKKLGMKETINLKIFLNRSDSVQRKNHMKSANYVLGKDLSNIQNSNFDEDKDNSKESQISHVKIEKKTDSDNPILNMFD